MNDLRIEEITDEAAYRTINAETPQLILSFEHLIAQGDTPEEVLKTVMLLEPETSTFMQTLILSACYYIKNQDSDVYKCQNCGETWTEDQLYKELKNNEDWVVLVQSCGQCPCCYELDLF